MKTWNGNKIMSKYLNNNEPGYEKPDKENEKTRPAVKNLYCPIDGHYCEQPQCENCNFEKMQL